MIGSGIGFDPGALLEGAHYVLRPSVAVSTQVASEDVSARVRSISINASMDNPVMQATVSLALGTVPRDTGSALTPDTDSISPFNTGSAHGGGFPLLRPGARIDLGFYISADGVNAVAPFVQPFTGRLDRVVVAGGLAQLQCRDVASWWLNTVLKRDLVAGTEAGTEASEVLRAIMATAAADFPDAGIDPNLLAEAPPDWMVRTGTLPPMPALEAMRIIAQQAGRDVRYFARNTNLTYYEPDRLNTAPDLVIDGRRRIAITALEWGDEDVRNNWEVWWQNDQGTPQGPVHLWDQASIDKYGDRYARVYLQRVENIRSETDALRFANAALADSSDPFASHSIVMPLEPRVELNDVHQYHTTGPEYDQDLTLAVVAFRHDWQAGQGNQPGVTRTTIGARGKRIAAYRDYRRSVAPKAILSNTPLDPALWAPDGTIHIQR